MLLSLINILHVLLLIFQKEIPRNKKLSPIVNGPWRNGDGNNPNRLLEMTFSLLKHYFDSFSENLPQLDVNKNSFAGADIPAARSLGKYGDSGTTDTLIVQSQGRFFGCELKDSFQEGQIHLIGWIYVHITQNEDMWVFKCQCEHPREHHHLLCLIKTLMGGRIASLWTLW